MSMATRHSKPMASPFSSPEHRFSWETKRALTLSVDDEFPGTLETMVASRDGDFPGTRAAVLASRAPPPCGPPTQPQRPPQPPAPLQLEEGPPLSEGPPCTVPLAVGQSLLSTSVAEQQPALNSVVNPPAPTGSRTPSELGFLQLSSLAWFWWSCGLG